MTGTYETDDLEYCAALVREGDPDRFATAMLAAMPLRGQLLSLYAFNLEVSKLRETVREAMLGEIRLQWWRDAIDECFAGTPRRHQVVHPLSVTISAGRLPKDVLVRLIDARSADIDELPPQNEAELSEYIEATGGGLGELAMRCAISSDLSVEGAEAGRAIGRAWAWVGLARGLYPHRRQGRRTVPATVLAANPDIDSEIERAVPGESVRQWVSWLLDRCEEDLARFSTVSTVTLRRDARPVVATGKLAAIYAARLRRSGCDPFQPALNTMGQARRAWALLGVGVFGRAV